jgi:HYR domain/Ricin-type beta-trefoil lectin domain-like/Secretion system C-terminal sorting domain
MTKPLLYASLLLSALSVLLSTHLSAQTAPPCFGDTTKPFFEICPASIVVNQVSSTNSCTNVQWVTPVAYDNCGVASLTNSVNNGFCFPVGLTTVAYTATDSSGNIATCLFSVTVRPAITNPCATDTVRPRFNSCPANIVLTTRDTCIATQWLTPVVFENCGTATLTSTHLSGACFPLGITTVVYTATDAKNNVGRCSFSITVNDGRDIPCATDTTKPVFTNCPANIVLVSADSCAPATWATVKATDNCGTPTVSSVYLPGACFRLGTTVVEYNATDAKLNRSYCTFTVTVNRPITVNPCASDTVKPRFVTCPTNIVLTTLDTCARGQWAVPTALDNCSAPSVIGNFQSGFCFKIGTTTVGYAATDSAGNKSYCSFTVTVNRTTINTCANDTIKPRFIFCPTNIVLNTLDSCAIARWNTPSATDNCATPTLTGSHQSGLCFKNNTTTTVNYTAKDAAGNAAVCAFTVTVKNPCLNDTTKPSFINCPLNIVLNSVDTCAIARWTPPIATDNCSTPSVISSHASGFCFKSGTTTVDYTATDAKGNKAVCSFKVTITNPCANDITKPTIYNCPTNIVKTTADTATIVTWRLPSAIDNCGAVTLAASHQSGARFKIGITTVTYTAIDSKGNRSVCSFTITVNRVITVCSNDTVPPIFTTCPSNISVSTASLSSIAQWVLPTATDNCSTPSVSSTFLAGSSFPIGTTVVTYIATDAARNVSFCRFNVVVTKTPLVIDSAKCYVLIARSSRKALTIAGASLTPAADAVQWTYQNSLNQKWKISPADSNSVNLTAKHSNLNLDTRWGVLTNGAKLMQWGKSTAATQKWQLLLLNDGYYKVINKGSKLALSVSGGPTMQTNGGALVQLNYANLSSQQWSIETVPCTATAGTVNFASNDILEIEAKPEHNRARIEWADNTGYKNDYYEVEKLNEKSGNFEQLAIVNNKSFDNTTTYQSIYDNTPNEGDNVYRVTVVYTDSSSKVSPLKRVSFNGLRTIKVFPNPANDYIDIDLTTFNNESVGVYLYDGFGKKVAFQNIEKGKASFVHFDLSNQQNGSYLVRVTAQGKRDVLKQVQVAR